MLFNFTNNATAKDHSLGSNNCCFLPCFTTDINGYLNGLIGETICWKLNLTSNKYHATQNPSIFIHSHDVITLPDEAEGWWFTKRLHGRSDSAHLGDGKCIFHFTPLAQRTCVLISLIKFQLIQTFFLCVCLPLDSSYIL